MRWVDTSDSCTRSILSLTVSTPSGQGCPPPARESRHKASDRPYRVAAPGVPMAALYSRRGRVANALTGAGEGQDGRGVALRFAEGRVDPQLVHGRDQAAEVVTDQFGQYLVLHGGVGLAPHRVTELPL